MLSPQTISLVLSQVLALLLVVVLAGCASVSPTTVWPADLQPVGTELTGYGTLTDARLPEVSGLALSNIDPDRLWVINDSGNPATLIAINRQAVVTGVWPIATRNRDWEALASLNTQDGAWLFIADTGDNRQQYAESVIHIVREPDSNTTNSKPLVPEHSLRFRFEDGPHDVEAMAATTHSIVMLSKERLTANGVQPSVVYELPWNFNHSESVQIARRIGTLHSPHRGIDTRVLTKLLQVDPLQPTDLAISSDEQHAWVLNYRQIVYYKKKLTEQHWATVFARKPDAVYYHELRQAESLTADIDAGIWITSEGLGSPLQAFRPRQLNNASRVNP